MSGSMQGKIGKTRKPRVQIRYDVEIGDAIEKKELPFVVGVMGDYRGNNSKSEQKVLKDRKFVDIDNDTIDVVMAKMQPGLNLKVDNKLVDDQTLLNVDLNFNQMEDFEPESIVEQVPVLKNLLDTRNQLKDLLSKADRSDNLEQILEKILTDSESLDKIRKDIEKGES